MQNIRSRDTKQEVRLRKALWHLGLRYRKNVSSLPGKPDIVFRKYKTAVFVDGDFWHGRGMERIQTNRDYWIPKLERNIARDIKVTAALEAEGWCVLRFWESSVKKISKATLKKSCAFWRNACPKTEIDLLQLLGEEILVNPIEMPPEPSALMESMRATGYSAQTAVADIIDNSIAAGASRVDIFYSPEEKFAAVLDNGCGMNSDGLNLAMKYGGVSPFFQRSGRDLGRFGLGLKTASLSQCKVLTVVSKQGGNISARRWDLEEIRRRKSWTLLELLPEEIRCVPLFARLAEYTGGTLVVWQELDRMFQGAKDISAVMAEKMSAVKKHLALVFHRYLAGETGLQKLEIYMNERAVEPDDPFLSGKSRQIRDKDFIAVGGHRVEMTTYQLPYPSKMSSGDYARLGLTEDLQKNQGFYVYRKKRLLTWGTWFGRAKKAALSQLIRVQMDIPAELDSLWALDVKKSSAMPPLEICRNLDAFIEKCAACSRRTWEWRGKNETSKNIQHVWHRIKTRGGVTYEINEEHPVIKNFAEKFPASAAGLSKILKLAAASLPWNSFMIDLNSAENEIENRSQDDAGNFHRRNF